MQPPLRVPLQAKPNGGNSKVMDDFTGSSKAFKATATAPKAGKRMVPPDQLEEFKQAIEGSDFTKLALVEALKKKYVTPAPSSSVTDAFPRSVDPVWKIDCHNKGATSE